MGTEIITDLGLYTFEGDGFIVKINVPEEANIPSGTELTVSEINPQSDKYLEHLGEAWNEINKEYLEVKEIKKDMICLKTLIKCISLSKIKRYSAAKPQSSWEYQKRHSSGW